MSYDINSVVVMGRLTRDVELRYSQEKKAFTKVSIAIQRDKNNTDFVDCVIFGKTAEFLENTAKKGTKIIIAGELRQSRWQDKDGNNRSKMEIIANNVKIVASTVSKNKETPTTVSDGGWDSGWNNQSF